jgi:mono/diheme cytochrome c family protein
MSDDSLLSRRSNDAMMSAIRPVAIIAGILVAVVVVSTIFVGSGVYNIGADDHHTALVLAAIEQPRDRSIAAHSSSIEVKVIQDPQRIEIGAQRYAALCMGCHLAPGVTKADVRVGLYPHPPNLVQGEVLPPQHAFWIIKHGIKMSAMPAWGKTLDDDTIWDLVAFLQKMPDMSAESYDEMSRPHSQ